MCRGLQESSCLSGDGCCGSSWIQGSDWFRLKNLCGLVGPYKKEGLAGCIVEGLTLGCVGVGSQKLIVASQVPRSESSMWIVLLWVLGGTPAPANASVPASNPTHIDALGLASVLASALAPGHAPTPSPVSNSSPNLASGLLPELSHYLEQ